jgi:hypothetical protein
MVDYDDEGQTSKFNAGMLQMTRLHKLQDENNLANKNPLAFDESYGIYNYEVVFANTTSMIEEAGNKLSTPEKKLALQLKKAIEKMLKDYPIHEVKKHHVYPYRSYTRLNPGNWDVFKNWIFKYEDMARGLLDKHHLNSPPEDESALF